MNFDDPGFDLNANKFVNTTGQTVQVGVGVVGSLFDNALQFSYGWNLNASRKGPIMPGVDRDRKRQYFGIGFGFLDVVEQVGKFVK